MPPFSRNRRKLMKWTSHTICRRHEAKAVRETTPTLGQREYRSQHHGRGNGEQIGTPSVCQTALKPFCQNGPLATQSQKKKEMDSASASLSGSDLLFVQRNSSHLLSGVVSASSLLR
eukprot:m.241214 g.241214  ORF g.241214 m.241214 type:complete len:117 (-) comp18876_c0_seq1:324-674(-)